MHPHCSNLSSLPLSSVLSFQVYTHFLSFNLSLLLSLHCAFRLRLVSLSFAAVLFDIVLNTPMLFVTSGIDIRLSMSQVSPLALPLLLSSLPFRGDPRSGLVLSFAAVFVVGLAEGSDVVGCV